MTPPLPPLSFVAHEVNGPLIAITGMGDTMRLTILLTTTLLLMLTLTVSAAPAPNPAFDKLHGIYISTIASYKAECNKSVIETPKVYIKSLIQLRSQLQQVGDLDGWEKVGEELKRFQSEPKVTPEQLDTSTGELNSLQRQHVKRRDEFQHVKHQKVLALMEMYVGRLNTMQVKLTKAGDFDGAFAIKKEIARVNGAPEIVEAEFSMSARRAKAAGFDIVYVYATHDYLIHSFLSSERNFRSDEYGGSVENRVRLLRELIEDAKNAREESEELLVKHKKMIAEADAEGQRVLNEAQALAEKSRDEIVEKAREEAARGAHTKGDTQDPLVRPRTTAPGLPEPDLRLRPAPGRGLQDKGV